jgi:hypothetical protein
MAGKRIQILAPLAMSALACAGRANVQADEPAIRALLGSFVRAMFAGVLEGADVKTALVANDIRVSRDLAVARGVQTGTATPKAGGPATPIQVKWVGVYARQADGSWRIAYDIWNSDLP